MRRVKFSNKEILKKTITCAVIVSSLAFSASSAMAEEISITNGLENPAANSIRNKSYYSSGNVLNLDSQSNFEVYGNIYEGSISGVANLIINGNNSSITSKSTNENANYGYKITDGSTIQIKDLTFDSFGYKEDVDWFVGSSKYSYGGGLYIQDDKSSVNLSNVSYTNSSLKGDGNMTATSNFYGAAIANNGSLNISDGVIKGGTINATNRWGGEPGGDAYGGAIYNTGNLTLTNVEVSSNSVTSVNNSEQALGGGIYTTKDITLAGGNTFFDNYDSNGNRANDIYFESGNLLVNGNGADKVNTISSVWLHQETLTLY